MSTHPLVEIRFKWAADPSPNPSLEEMTDFVDRHWYHVPRIGDDVLIFVDDEHGVIDGRVIRVVWSDGKAMCFMHPTRWRKP